jgi:hypothetical protein
MSRGRPRLAFDAAVHGTGLLRGAKVDRRSDGAPRMTYDRDRALGAWLLITAGVVEAAMLLTILVT